MDIGYTDVSMADRTWVPENEGEERKPFVLRVPVSLLRKMKAAAEAETVVRKREVTVTSMVVQALKDHYAEYEKDHGPLPPPSSRDDDTKKSKRGAKTKTPPSKAIVEYAAAVAKKRGH